MCKWSETVVLFVCIILKLLLTATSTISYFNKRLFEMNEKCNCNHGTSYIGNLDVVHREREKDCVILRLNYSRNLKINTSHVKQYIELLLGKFCDGHFIGTSIYT